MAPRRQLGLLWGGVALALVALAPFAPRLAAGLPPCPLRAFAGVPCAACGTTRAALALARLEPLAALALNPLATLGWMALVGGGLGALVWAAAGAPAGRWPRLPAAVWRLSLAAALLANWLYLLHRGI